MKSLVGITLLTILAVALYVNFARVNPSIDIAKGLSDTEPMSASVVIGDGGRISAVKDLSKPKNLVTIPYLRLLGTFIADEKEENIASIKNLLTGITGEFKHKDKIDGWEIVDIALGEVVLNKHGNLFNLTLIEEANKETITVLSSTQRLVDKTALAVKLSDLTPMLKAISVSPYCDSANNLKGIEIKSIDRDEDKSLAHKAGIEEGDVILSVNDCKVDNFMSLLGLYREIRNTSEIVVRINRDGTNKELTYYLN